MIQVSSHKSLHGYEVTYIHLGLFIFRGSLFLFGFASYFVNLSIMQIYRVGPQRLSSIVDQESKPDLPPSCDSWDIC
jgi:hypothetical protein